MERLIDAYNLIEIIKNIQDHMREVNKNPVPVDAREIFTLFIGMVEKQPTAYDTEIVVKEVQDQLYTYDIPTDLLDDIIRNGGVK